MAGPRRSRPPRSDPTTAVATPVHRGRTTHVWDAAVTTNRAVILCDAWGMPVPLMLGHSPLVGPTTWKALARAIRERGHEVLVPDLTASLTDGTPYWSRQVDAIADSAAGRQVILVGHSGAGPLLAIAGDTLDQVKGYVFIDAGLPFPGRSWLETAPPALADQLRAMANDGWLPPWSEWWGADGLAELLPDPEVRKRFAAGCPRLPMAMFEEVQPPVPGWPDAGCAYLRLSAAYQEPAERAKALGWPMTELASHHLAVLTDPELVVGPLLDLVRQLQRESPRTAQ